MSYIHLNGAVDGAIRVVIDSNEIASIDARGRFSVKIILKSGQMIKLSKLITSNEVVDDIIKAYEGTND